MSAPPTGLTDPRSLDELFWEWLPTANAREVIGLMRSLNARLRSRGFMHYGLNALGEAVRWHLDIEHGPDASGFKVNSIYMSRLARWLMHWYPDEFPPRCGCSRHVLAPLTYFELRELKSGPYFDPGFRGPRGETREPATPRSASTSAPGKENTTETLPVDANAPLFLCRQCDKQLMAVRQSIFSPDEYEGRCPTHGRTMARVL